MSNTKEPPTNKRKNDDESNKNDKNDTTNKNDKNDKNDTTSKNDKNDTTNKNDNKPPRKKHRQIIMPLLFETFFSQLPGDGDDPLVPIEVVKEESKPFEDEKDYPHNGQYEFLNIKLENIYDLIKLGLDFKEGVYDPHTRYNINLFKVCCLHNPLEELKKMIGMENIKRDIFDIIMYQLQEFDTKKDMLHTIIEGEPGVGKTDLTKIIAKIYQSMGYLTNKTIKFVKRSDLIGGYLGQTAIKTQKILDECKGGVLIIDEAYSLGNPGGKDSYSKECIDTLTAYLSECPETIVFIIGYKDALEKCFFSVNKGLERRFGYRFSIDTYEPEHLRLILFKIIEQNDWKVDKDSIKNDFFEENKDYFIFNGGDMLNLFTKSKFSHSKRYFTEQLNYDKKKIINMDDIQNGFKMLMDDSKFAERKNQTDDLNNNLMYT